jgi:hypothetical protein
MVEVLILDHVTVPTWQADRRTVGDLQDRYIEEVLRLRYLLSGTGPRELLLLHDCVTNRLAFYEK